MRVDRRFGYHRGEQIACELTGFDNWLIRKPNMCILAILAILAMLAILAILAILAMLVRQRARMAYGDVRELRELHRGGDAWGGCIGRCPFVLRLSNMDP